MTGSSVAGSARARPHSKDRGTGWCGRSRARGVLVAVCLVAGLAAVVPGEALASGLEVRALFCRRDAENSKSRVCKAGYKKSELPSEEQATIMAHMKYESAGIDGKPTIKISGANVQIVNGEGTTATTNGEGNLVIGYDEEPGDQGGSHNLILGGPQQAFTSYGGILGGDYNTISARYASVIGGSDSAASGPWALVVGGVANTASGSSGSVGGGADNTAKGDSPPSAAVTATRPPGVTPRSVAAMAISPPRQSPRSVAASEQSNRGGQFLDRRRV